MQVGSFTNKTDKTLLFLDIPIENNKRSKYNSFLRRTILYNKPHMTLDLIEIVFIFRATPAADS